MSLKKQAVSGLVWTYGQQFGSQLISFVVSVILARLIMPEEFGLIGMITIFMSIGTTLFNGGLSSSLIRSTDLVTDDYSTVFYFNLIGSVVIYLCLFLAAPLISEFYHQPELTNITRVYGLSFIISAFGTVQNTLLIKELRFKRQLVINLPALIISSVISILMAFAGYGVWSLVASALINSFFASLFLWLRSDWYPTKVFDKEKFKQHFHYGYKLTLSGLMDIFFNNIYQIIIGRFYSPAQVGYYTRANTLMMLPVSNVSSALNRVVFPVFAKIKDDIPRLRNAYKQVMLMVLFIISPIIVLMGVLGEPLIILLFTEKWLPVVPIFRILCFTAILYPIHAYNLLVLQVNGRSDLFLRLEIIKKVLLSLIIFIAFYGGFYALLWGQLVFSIVALFINTHYAGKLLKYAGSKQIIDIIPILFFSLLLGTAAFLIDKILFQQSHFLRVVLSSLIGVTIYISAAWLYKFQSLADIKSLIFKK